MEFQITSKFGVVKNNSSLFLGFQPIKREPNPLLLLPATAGHGMLRLPTVTKRRLCMPKAAASRSSQPATAPLPPRPWELPLIGNIHHLFAGLPHHALRDLARVHGPLMLLRLGEIDQLVVSSREAAEEIMRTQDLNFIDRPPLIAPMIILYGGKDMSFAPYSAYWRQLRRLCVTELLSGKRVRSYSSLREEETTSLIHDIAVATADGGTVNLSERLTAVSNNIVCRATFGHMCRDQSKFITYMEEAITMASGFSISDLYPSFQFIDNVIGMRPKLEMYHRKIDEILAATIQAHQMSRNEGEEQDLINVLLDLKDHGDYEIPITIESIKAIIFDMFTGGTETSSGMLQWVMSELMRNPEVMEKAQKEVREAMKGKGKVEESDIEKLSYIEAVVKETLRLHPPLPLLLPRVCKETTQVLGYTIPAGTRVMINAWALGRDPKYWEDAEEFKPERFENNDIAYRGSDFEYIPFGAGRRICPGMSFGLATVEMALTQILYYFDWKLPRGMKPEDVDMAETFGPTSRRKSALFLHATPCYPLPRV
ncbi:premnaspirodiene oxygenase-like [Canna indica]|uniref:Premnaspirodiene oxygenase-like n=1 Tax=Canna indica TaxID=4628 RepID=A0AAQ3KC63_9LILI|nr:premnaspirodiene oxygenase-like [Canna indica]